MAAPLSKPSTAWKYFDANKDELKNENCKAKLAGDGTKSSLFNTSNLLKFCGTKVLVSVICTGEYSYWSEKKSGIEHP